MERAKAMTYEELMKYAKAHYNKGGDAIYECWEEYQFNDYVEMFGPITKSKALAMFRLERSMQKEREGWR